MIEEVILEKDTEIVAVNVSEGDYVVDDQILFTFRGQAGNGYYLTDLYGTVRDIRIAPGQVAVANQVLMTIEVDESR